MNGFRYMMVVIAAILLWLIQDGALAYLATWSYELPWWGITLVWTLGGTALITFTTGFVLRWPLRIGTPSPSKAIGYMQGALTSIGLIGLLQLPTKWPAGLKGLMVAITAYALLRVWTLGIQFKAIYESIDV